MSLTTDLDRLDAVELPTTDQEIWRYSRIGELKLDDYRPSTYDVDVQGADAYLDDGSAAALLDEAEDILNAVGDRIRSEVEEEQARSGKRKGLKRFFGRRRKS